MYRILIVEDEPPIARYLCRLLEDDQEFQVAAVAENGEEGLLLCEKYQPDLIITDVRMPVMDGLSMLEKVKERNPAVKGLIVSDYRDFEYARNGLRLGVENYLIKPVTLEQMKENLRSIRERLDEEKEKQRQEKFLALLWGEAEKNQGGKWEAQGPYRLLVLQEGCVRSFRMKYAGTENRPGERKSRKALAQMKEQGGLVAWTYGEEENVAIALCRGGEEEICREMAEQEGYWTLVCSRTFQNMNSLRKLYRECQKILYYQTVIGKNQIIWQERRKEEDGEREYLENRRENFRQAAARGDFELAKNELVSCFDELEQKAVPQYLVERTAEEILSYMKNRRRISYEQQQDSLAEIFLVARNLTEVLGGILELLSESWEFEKRAENGRKRSGQVMQNIEEYVDSHLGEVFSLQDLSGIFGLSQTYICRLFHNYREKSFKDYITERKVEKAQEFLRQGMQVKEVSEILGYQDPFYFSKVFKKKTGRPPSEFWKRGKI